MSAWQYVAWGVFGGFAVEGWDFIRAVRRCLTWPWRDKREPAMGPYLVSVVFRLIIGGGLALVLGASHQLSGPFGAFAAGVAAPLILEKLALQYSLGTGKDVDGGDTDDGDST